MVVTCVILRIAPHVVWPNNCHKIKENFQEFYFYTTTFRKLLLAHYQKKSKLVFNMVIQVGTKYEGFRLQFK